jgi:ribonuclease T1
MRTLIAAVALATTAAFGSTAYAAPAPAPTTSTAYVVAAPAAIDTCVYYTDDHYASFCEVDENS